MKKLFIVITALVATSVGALGQFAISSPTNSQTFYADETLQIRWSGADRTANSGMVRCYLSSNGKNETYFGARPADNGGVDWAVSKLLELGLGGTNYTLRVESAQNATVQIVLLAGSRPAVVTPPPTVTPRLVPITTKAKMAMSVEWDAVAGHYYVIEMAASIDAEWSTIDEGQVDVDQHMEINYLVAAGNGFFRVVDTTPE